MKICMNCGNPNEDFHTKSENLLDPNSCWNRAESEPIFVLRANDPEAPNIIVLWAAKYMLAKSYIGKLTPTQIKKYRDAMEIANLMRDWRIKKGLDDDIAF